MKKSKNSNQIRRLAQARRQFSKWRAGPVEGRWRIPEALWRLAVKLAGQYGIHETSRSLRLSYMALKRQMERRGELPSAPKSTFVEVVPAGALLPSGSLIELEKPGGAKVRVQLKAGETLDVTALMRNFWETGA